MHHLEKEDRTILTDQKDILNETELYYKHLYSSRETELENTDLDEYIGQNMNTLTGEQAEKLEGSLTLQEILDTLKNMKNDKSPGLSGFSAEFFKVFRKQLGSFCIKVIKLWIYNW